ncbi:MAG TPA: CHRD domain-containing protein [Sphingomicrobium sp.]|jgi:hypothetical protein|nr:CHRD domain-containing protein [Sphingomicrobium sp.]
MRRAMTAVAIIAAAAFGTSALSAQDFTGKRFDVTLSGADHVEGGDPDGSGSAMVRINLGQRQLCYTLSVSGIQAANAAHIHEAPAGATGPVVVNLQAPSSGMSQGCVTISREMARDLIQNPQDYYINVHNMEYPGGAVRGQLDM